MWTSLVSSESLLITTGEAFPGEKLAVDLYSFGQRALFLTFPASLICCRERHSRPLPHMVGIVRSHNLDSLLND